MVASKGKTPSRREKFLKKLRKLVKVDVYGNCGKLECDSREIISTDLKKYKFYLAFENSLCKDYVTEKVYKIMNQNIIPVVYNGADMSRFLPPKSVTI